MIATNIQQSKHLLELGLDPKTADMWWSNRFVYWSPTPMIGVAAEKNQLYTFKWYETDIPAWSLTALLEVMPETIKSDDTQYYFHLEKSVQYNWHFISYYFDDVDELYELKTTKQYENPITAAFEMVCWLLEHGLIEKGDNDE